MATRIQWLGHSCLLIESGGRNALIDPYLTDNPAAGAKADEVPADVIVVSHGHFDHVGDAASIARRTGAPIVTNYEIADWFKKQGVATTHGLQHSGGIQADPSFHVKLTGACHTSGLPDGTYGGNAHGLLITTADGSKIYDAADTGLFGDMALIGDEGVDLALLPIGDYFTMGPADSIRAIRLIRPKKVIPIHYDTLPPIRQDARAWAERVRSETDAEPIVPEVGAWTTVR